MKFSKKIVTESLNQPNSGLKVYTEGKKQNIVISEEQFERLISTVNESNEETITKLIKESYELIRKAIINEKLDLNVDDYSYTVISEAQDEWKGHNPGVSAAAGIENIINSIHKAYEMIKDSDTRKKIANSITKLGNFMTITADAIASGRDHRAPRPSDSLRDPLPYPELDEEIKEETKPDFLDLDGDGDKEESMKKASKEVKEDSGHDEAMNYGRDEGHDDKELYDLKHDGGSEEHIDDLEDDMHYDHIHDSEKERENLIKEDIKKMKQIIKPIEKV